VGVRASDQLLDRPGPRAGEISERLAAAAEQRPHRARDGQDDVTMRDRLEHWLLQPLRPQASGGISGVLAFYALRFPHRRVRLTFNYTYYDVRVWAAMTLWVLLQVAGAVAQVAVHGTGGVAYFAHLGGAAVGVLFWLGDRAVPFAPRARLVRAA
jgi:hypothetical protein